MMAMSLQKIVVGCVIGVLAVGGVVVLTTPQRTTDGGNVAVAAAGATSAPAPEASTRLLLVGPTHSATMPCTFTYTRSDTMSERFDNDADRLHFTAVGRSFVNHDRSVEGSLWLQSSHHVHRGRSFWWNDDGSRDFSEPYALDFMVTMQELYMDEATARELLKGLRAVQATKLPRPDGTSTSVLITQVRNETFYVERKPEGLFLKVYYQHTRGVSMGSVTTEWYNMKVAISSVDELVRILDAAIKDIEHLMKEGGKLSF